MRTSAAFVVSAACLAGLSLSAQSVPTDPQAIFRTGVDIVRLDVSVLGRDRLPIRGLTASDFTVLEDGKPQPIVAFSAVDIPHAIDPPSRWMRDVGSDVTTNQLDTRRIVVIVMDDAATMIDARVAARRIARGVIDRLGPNDLAAVVFTCRGRPQNFTSDQRQLLAAADAFVPMKSAAPGRMTAAYSATGPAAPGTSLACGLGPGLSGTFKHIASALQDTPSGRKTVVLVSSGAPIKVDPELLDEALGTSDLREIFENLQRANINVYPIDPAGLTSEGLISARIDSLRVFAESTGGRATVATNYPWDHVAQVFIENSSYYLLGIRPANASKDGRFQRIAVKVNRPEVDVRTRSGYYAARPISTRSGAKPDVQISGLEKAFRSVLPTGDLPLEVGVAAFAAPGDKQAVVAVMIGTRRPVSNAITVEKLDVRTTALDYPDFKERGTHRQTAELTLRPTESGERRIELQSRLTLRPGRYEVRVGAEGPAAAGSVYTHVDVPDFSKARLGASGLVLGRPRAEGATADLLSDLIPVVPTTARIFQRSDAVAAFLRIYQGGRDSLAPVQVRTRIVDTANRAVVEGPSTLTPEHFQVNRAADFQLALPFDRLDAGEYLLTIEASHDKTRISRDARFVVK
jgi:VWFA-related protein